MGFIDMVNAKVSSSGVLKLYKNETGYFRIKLLCKWDFTNGTAYCYVYDAGHLFWLINNRYFMVLYREYKPRQQLANYIKSIYCLKLSERKLNPSYQRITPDGCFELNFNFGDPLRRVNQSGDERNARDINASYLIQRRANPYLIKRTGVANIIGIRFHPWGLYPFTGIPAHMLVDKLFPIEDIFGRGILELQEELFSANMEKAIYLIENYFIKLYEKKYREDTLVTDICQRLTYLPADDNNLGKALAGLNLSERRLQQRFHEVVGFGPKTLCRIIRFQNVLKKLNSGDIKFLTKVAFDCDYFDQSHFIREFKFFSGITPRQYLLEQHPLNDLMVSSV